MDKPEINPKLKSFSNQELAFEMVARHKSVLMATEEHDGQLRSITWGSADEILDLFNSLFNSIMKKDFPLCKRVVVAVSSILIKEGREA